MFKRILLGSGSYGGVRKPAVVVSLAVCFASLLVLAGVSGAAVQPSFGKSNLSGESSARPTSLQYGPDGRLYVAQQNGTIKAYTVKRIGKNNYDATGTETIDLVKNIQNHDDDGSPNGSVNNRQVTGLVVTGTAAKPVIYVGSSDPRIGGGGDAKDTNLDTNSGVISKLTKTSSGWNKVDLLRGLPRSEENHSINGLQLSPNGNKLYVAQGGNTNKGAPSNNFTFLPEYALSAAILSVDLNAIGNTTYDLPTLAGGSNPFGGDGGNNQAKLVSGGPVQVHAPGFRNPYDLVIAESGKMYTIDNGGNGGWGDIPKNEGPGGDCTNEVNEPGTSDTDSLHFVDGPGYYGGHPNPTRGNKNNTFGGQSPVPSANAVECDYRANGSDKGNLTNFPASTNGIVEYTATNFEGAMKGDLLTAGFDNKIYRMQLNAAGDGVTSKEALFSNVNTVPLDVTAQGDNDPFPGTVWAADIASGNIVAFEPDDFGGGGSGPCDTSNPDGDADGDGYTNKDEDDNGTDPCSSADVPPDADKDGISNLNDPDDDNDNIPDNEDKFALDPDNGKSTKLPVKYSFDAGSKPGTLLDLGFTGLMTNGTSDYEDLYDPNNIVSGGASPVLTVESVSNGDAYQVGNSQENGFQYGVDIGPNTGPFTAHTRIVAPFAGIQPKNFQSMGLTIGPGDQDNYVKLTTAAAGGEGGIEFAKEVNAKFNNRPKPSVPMPGPDAVDLFLTVDPAANTVQPSYTVTTDGKEGERKQLGGPEPIPASWVDGTDALAAGLISTSFGAQSFPATWDFLNVTPDGSTPPPADSEAGAKVTMTPNNQNINASTYNPGSFKVTNTSDSEKLDSVTLDLGTAILPDMIFDPEGKAGDNVAKKFTVDTEGGTGQSGDALIKPHNGTNGADGYDALKIDFDNFDPGETFAFSIDVDPNSIKGTFQPGPNQAGSVSGLELAGSTITTAFDDGTTAKNKAFSDGSNAGSAAVVKTDSATAPELQVVGVSSAKETVSEAKQTVKVTGPAGSKVQLLRLEAGLFVAPDGGYNVDPYDANSAVALNKQPATIGSNGTVNIPVTLTRQADPEAGLNHLVAVIEDTDGDAGLTSNVVVLDYDESSAPPANEPPTMKPIGDQKGVEGEKFSLQVEASDTDEGDTLSYSAQKLPAGLSIGKESGQISGTIESGAAADSPYTVKVTVSDGEAESSETFQMTVTKPDSPGTPSELEMKPAGPMNFGKVKVGETSIKGVTVANIGESKTIEVSAAKIDGAKTFSSSLSQSVELKPGESHNLKVTFAPTRTGLDKANLLIDHTGDNDKLNLSLAGRGVPGAGGCTIMGTDGDDTLRGTAGRDVICGLGGDDKLYGFRGDDLIRGGSGNDRLVGGPGDDRLYGQDGRDFLFGISGEDYANGGRGNDVIRGNQDNDRLVGTLGNDVVIGGKDDDTMFGGPGTDKLYGQGGQDRLFGITGDDYANGGSGNDLIRGDEGDDRLVGATGNDRVIGSENNDTMFGGPGRDRLFGQGGDDRLFGISGPDYANGGSGNDLIRGNQGNDRLVGATGNDTVIGSEHNDTMFGGPGRDRLFGQEGRDILIIRDGVRGNDSANGGPGPDRCAADPGDRVVSCQ